MRPIQWWRDATEVVAGSPLTEDEESFLLVLRNRGIPVRGAYLPGNAGCASVDSTRHNYC